MALIALAVLAVGGGATAVVLGTGGEGQAGSGGAGLLPPNTATVTRQTLRDTRTESGQLGYGDATSVVSRMPGTLTKAPATDARISRGQALFNVDNQPVVLMYGRLPAYRRLAPGDEGADVKQLEQNLKALGYGGFTVDDEYTSATADAVKRWQKKLGLPETGVVDLGRVVFAPAAIRVDALSLGVGDPVTPGAKVLTYTGTAKAVAVDLDTADQRLAKRGATVQVTLPDDRTVTGKITEVATVIRPGDSPGGQDETKVAVIVRIDDQQAAAAFTVATVDVTFTAAERADVLTVPVAALVALSEGGFGVEVVSGGSSRYAAVETGLFADGRVEISGAGVAEGDAVGMPA
ncbi:peptidoglycan-binding protein [Rhizomonospora bruguierae]|uniref:peptidoglycan-binding protein n=1 Tax=Rhizomonospora bruguierae TaxID=1581705 RepID=UPI0020C07688|nr:peptidoglycan-binding protein [Micromonospora sp. NBRC 107566]